MTSPFRRPGARVALVALLLTPLAGTALGQMGMPDPKQMSGTPLPTGDLPDGAVSVRLIRGQLSNNVPSHPAELHERGGKVWTMSTDETGRAQFTGVPVGTLVHAVATVDGERLESQEFQVPAKGGVRVMLVASDAASGAGGPQASGTATAAPPQPGTVVIGGESRIVIEVVEDALQVFYLFDIMNGGRAPVNPETPVTFELPDGAQGVGVLQGSSSQATAAGPRVRVAGPFQPGRTHVEVGFVLPYSGGDVGIAQKLPAALNQLTLVAQKVGDMQLVSSQIASRKEMPAEGQTYIIANGPAIAAGGTLAVELSGLPHHRRAPRYVALALAIAVLGLGFWFAAAPPADTGAVPRRKKLLARRDVLFATLVNLEHERQAGKIEPPRYQARRREILAQLERIYGALDEGLAA